MKLKYKDWHDTCKHRENEMNSIDKIRDRIKIETDSSGKPISIMIPFDAMEENIDYINYILECKFNLYMKFKSDSEFGMKYGAIGDFMNTLGKCSD